MRLDTITELLGIPNYKVTHVIQNDGSSFHFIVDYVEPLPPVCSGCGRVHAGGIHSVWVNMVEDLPISGKRVFLHVLRRKVHCLEDGTIRVNDSKIDNRLSTSVKIVLTTRKCHYKGALRLLNWLKEA